MSSSARPYSPTEVTVQPLGLLAGKEIIQPDQQAVRQVPVIGVVHAHRGLSNTGTTSGDSDPKTAGLPSVVVRIPKECWRP